MADQGVAARLLGAWSLQSWYYEAPDGMRTYPLGEDAVGQLMYDRTYTVDTDRSEVAHHVNGSWFPNHVGTHLVRRYTLIANELALDANTGSDIARLVWRKLG